MNYSTCQVIKYGHMLIQSNYSKPKLNQQYNYDKQ